MNRPVVLATLASLTELAAEPDRKAVTLEAWGQPLTVAVSAEQLEELARLKGQAKCTVVVMIERADATR